MWELPSVSVVKTSAFIAIAPGSIPGWGTKIPHAIQCGQK